MLRKVLGLPLRVAKRVLTLMDGERSAPYPGPPMDVTAPEPSPATPVPDPTPAAAPKKTTQKKAAQEKAAPKKTTQKKAAQEKAAPKKTAAESSVTVNPEVTPNPNAMKFTLNQTVCETGSFSFTVDEKPVEHAIAAAILEIAGVETVFGVNDFVTVTKQADVTWDALIPDVVAAIKAAA